jgi:putative addiction module component (TIGR02574 family)
MTLLPKREDLHQMSVAERLRLIEEVWSSLTDRPEGLDMPSWHKDELDSRLATHEGDPSTARPWNEVKIELQARKRR